MMCAAQCANGRQAVAIKGFLPRFWGLYSRVIVEIRSSIMFSQELLL